MRKFLLSAAFLAFSGLAALAQAVPSSVISYGGGASASGGGSCSGSFCAATAPLAPNLGGTGLNNSGATGFPLWTAGVQSIISSTGTGVVVRATSPSIATGLTLSFATGSGARCLHVDNVGAVTIASADCGTGGGTPGGSNTQVQYNNASAFGGISGFTTNGTVGIFANNALTITGATSGTSIINAPATGGGTATLFPGTDTIVGLAATQTLTNKSIVATQLTGTLQAVQMPALTGDITTPGSSLATTLATVNANVGSFTAANITVNAKGLITAAANGSAGGMTLTSAPGVSFSSGATCTTTCTVSTSVFQNAQTGTSYAIVAGDGGKIISSSNASAVGFTLSQANQTGFTAGFGTDVHSIGAGITTITATTSTFDNGLVTLAVAKGQDASIWSDGTNYHSIVSVPVMATSTLLGNNSGTTNYPTAQTVGTGVLTAMGNALSAAGGVTSTIASGTSAMGTSAITSGTCASVVTTAATNTATTDTVLASFNGDPTAVTGYAPTTNGMLTIIGYPTANNVNFKVCNNTSSSVTPGAITLNWRILR